MKFNFKIQQYQTDAVDAVVKVFDGQGFHDKISYIRDVGKIKKEYNVMGEEIDSGRQDVINTPESDDIYDDTGYKNETVMLTDEQLLHNIRKIQSENNIKLSPNLVKDLGM